MTGATALGRGMDERHEIQTRVGELAVRVRGEGPPAVLWHSLFVDERSWGRVEEGLARDRRVVIITGPGHGASADPGHRYTMDDCAAAAGEVLAALDIDGPVDWVGNAWGGHVGIVFAATWPDRCRTLVTFGTPVQAYTWSEQVLFRVLLAVYRVAGMIGYLSGGIVDALLSPRTRANDPEAVNLVLDCLRSMERRALANAMRSISLGRPDLTPRLGAIRCPTVFVTGADHSGWTPGQAEAKCRLLATGAVAVIPDTAYLTPLEDPAETIRIVRDLWGASQLPQPSA
jgi:pimeloyl-ACP methyl ester carboxylesterase